MYKSSLRVKALEYLKKREPRRALISLLDLRKLTLLSVLVLLIPNLLNTLAKVVLGRFIYQFLGFEKIIDILTVFSYPKPWARYIKSRKKTPSYFFSVALANVLTKNSQTVVDVGCGTGQLMEVLSRKTNPGNVLGIDKSFLSLLLARRFFTSAKNLLICVDVEDGLPFKSESIDLVLSTDSFHYIKQKSTFLKECFRIVETSGLVVALHIINSTKVVFGNIRGITPRGLSRILVSGGFRHWIFMTNTNLWKRLKDNGLVTLHGSDPASEIENCFAYGFYAGKKAINRSFSLTGSEYGNLKKGQIDFSKDKALLNDLNLESTLNKFNHFIFLSPHLDDVVLSCGLLLEKVASLGKEADVITIFTKASPPPLTKLASEFTQKSGYKNPHRLFEDRKLEDKKALKIFKAKYRHLDYVDAAFRKVDPLRGLPSTRYLSWLIPKLVHVYPKPKKQFSGQVSILDRKLSNTLLKDLKKIVIKVKKTKTLILAPLGIGGHADHVIVRDISRRFGLPVLFWSDFPYNTHEEGMQKFFSEEKGYKEFFKIKDSKAAKKIRAVRRYKSQVPVLFPQGKIPNIPETYYIAEESKI